MFIIRGLGKEDAVHINVHNGILVSHRKEWNKATCSNMDATRDDQTKWSQSEKERQIPHDITYEWNLNYGTNKPIWNWNKIMGGENRSVVAKGTGLEEGWIGYLG